MILVDTSVLIKFLRGQTDSKTILFEKILRHDIPFGISSYTYQEILQGARDINELQTLKTCLSTTQIYFLKQEAATNE